MRAEFQIVDRLVVCTLHSETEEDRYCLRDLHNGLRRGNLDPHYHIEHLSMSASMHSVCGGAESLVIPTKTST
jgi:hypothetical protein|tara:strand:+ start:2204 stop:2422 length:219 start_codon:yes stop_codon:yes gene_type:complete